MHETKCRLATATIFSISFDILVWKSSEIFKLIENFENSIEKCEFLSFDRKNNSLSITTESTIPGMADPTKQPIFENKIASFEKWTELIDFFMVKYIGTSSIAINITTAVIRSTYYTTGIIDEDYVLVNLIW